MGCLPAKYIAGNCKGLFSVKECMLLQRLKQLIRPGHPVTEPEAAYDLWANGYDHQPGNLMLALDTEVFSGMLDRLSLTGSQLIDVGCGTGRHWYHLLEQRPARLVGYDVSVEMLRVLKKKFPGQELHRQIDHLLKEPDKSFDLLISTLTIAHIKNAGAALQEWCRVLKPGGYMIITDFHPETLSRGGERTFSHEGKTISVKNYVHPLPWLVRTAHTMGMELVDLVEKRIDDNMRSWYEAKGALQVFEKYKGSPIIYGCCLKRSYAAT